MRLISKQNTRSALHGFQQLAAFSPDVVVLLRDVDLLDFLDERINRIEKLPATSAVMKA